jgi:hypothetical protein
MFIDKKNLLFLIEQTIEKVLAEQETPTEAPPEPAEETTPEPETAEPEAPDAPVDQTTTPGLPGAGEISDDTEPGTDTNVDSGGTGVELGSLGGGMDFGNKGMSGLDADEPEEEKTISTVGPEDVEIPADPVMAIVDDAIQLLNQTKQPQVILQTVKGQIQRYFTEIEDATPVIKNLWDTEDVVLRDVARRLLLFIKGI